MTVPMKNGVWVNYFEDIPFMDKLWNLNQYSPMETARYLMDHPQADPEWRAHVTALIDFVEKTFAVDFKDSKGAQWGANAISEQLDYMPKMGSHTSRYASVQARWAEVTGDAAAKEKAHRSLNWATYMSDEHGVVNDQPYLQHAGVWFSDGYGDYIRHFMYAVGAQPDWASEGQNHLLRSSSVVSDVRYESRRISYRTFDKEAEEVLRVAFIPAAVRSGGTELAKQSNVGTPGWQFDPRSGALRIRHIASGDVEVVASK